jgi:hypothetical protein
LKNGSKIAEVWTGCAINSTPAVLSNGTIVSGCNKGKVVWARNGKVEQSVYYGENGSYLNSSPAILNDGTVVLGSEKKFYWIKDGNIKFEFITGESVSEYPSSNGAPAIMDDGTVVFASNDGNIYWLKDGKETFRFVNKVALNAAPIVLSDQTVVIGVEGKVLWLKNGQISYQFLTDYREALTTASVVSADDTILVGSNYGSLYWLKNGELKRKLAVTYKRPSSENIYAAKFVSGLISFNPEVAVASGWESELVWTQTTDVSYRMPTSNIGKTPAFLSDGSIVSIEKKQVIVYH